MFQRKVSKITKKGKIKLPKEVRKTTGKQVCVVDTVGISDTNSLMLLQTVDESIYGVEVLRNPVTPVAIRIACKYSEIDNGFFIYNALLFFKRKMKTTEICYPILRVNSIYPYVEFSNLEDIEFTTFRQIRTAELHARGAKTRDIKGIIEETTIEPVDFSVPLGYSTTTKIDKESSTNGKKKTSKKGQKKHKSKKCGKKESDRKENGTTNSVSDKNG